VVERAHKPALENGEVAFNRVGGHTIARILALTVADSFMLGEDVAQGLVELAFVRVDGGRRGDVLLQRIAQGAAIDALELERTGLAAALYKRDDFI
jgi:hypothetical protein